MLHVKLTKSSLITNITFTHKKINIEAIYNIYDLFFN